MYYMDFENLFASELKGKEAFGFTSADHVFEDFVAPSFNVGGIIETPKEPDVFSTFLSDDEVKDIFASNKNDNDFSYPLPDYGYDFGKSCDYGKSCAFDTYETFSLGSGYDTFGFGETYEPLDTGYDYGNTVEVVDTVCFADDHFYSQSAHEFAYYECGFPEDAPSYGEYECGFSSDSPSYGEYETCTDYDYDDM